MVDRRSGMNEMELGGGGFPIQLRGEFADNLCSLAFTKKRINAGLFCKKGSKSSDTICSLGASWPGVRSSGGVRSIASPSCACQREIVSRAKYTKVILYTYTRHNQDLTSSDRYNFRRSDVSRSRSSVKPCMVSGVSHISAPPV